MTPKYNAQGVFKYFAVVSFKYCLREGATLWLAKVKGLGPWPSRPPLSPVLLGVQNREQLSLF